MSTKTLKQHLEKIAGEQPTYFQKVDEVRFEIKDIKKDERDQDAEKSVRKRVDCLFDVAKAISAHGAGLWFRGQTSVHDCLEPGIFRDKKRKKRKRTENNLNLRFRAKTLLKNHPSPAREDLVSWLFLAQHFFLETRILDWSESLLPALFFAADGDREKYEKSPATRQDHERGALYCLDPHSLNKKMLKKRWNRLADTSGQDDYAQLFPEKSAYFNSLYRGRRIVYPDHPEVLMMARRAFNRHYSDPCDKRVPLAVMSEAIDARQVVQQGTFTIHGAPECFNVAKSNGYLLEISFPIDLNRDLRRGLKIMGISKSVLFPNLEHLPWDLHREFGIE